MLLDLLRLGRWEGPTLGAVLVLAGWVLAGGSLPPPPRLWTGVLLIGPGALGFVYGLNGITDRVEDAVSKPHRPLVTGRLPVRLAALWVTLLAALTPTLARLLVPELLWTVLLVLVLGLAYSQPPLRLKRWPPAATAVIALLLHAPLVAGTLLAGPGPLAAPWLVASFVLCLATLPLKDIEDEAGDRAARLGNWAAWIGAPRLVLASIAVVAPLGLAALLLLDGWARLGVAGACGATCVVAFVHLACGWPIERLYTRLVRTILVLGVALPLVAWLLR